MRRQLIRALLRLYPSAWRKRYGSEFEQLILDCRTDDPSLQGTARLLIDIAGHGFAQRFRLGVCTRIIVVACLCAGAGIAVDATLTSASDTLVFPATPIGVIWIAPNAFLPANVTLLHAPAWEFPSTSEPLPHRTTVQLLPGSTRVVGISGPPTNTVLNPKTGRIVAVKPLSHGSPDASATG